MSPGIVTPKEAIESQPTSLRLPKDILNELKQICSETGRNRNETIVQLLRFALDAHWKGAGRKPKK